MMLSKKKKKKKKYDKLVTIIDGIDTRIPNTSGLVTKNGMICKHRVLR